MADVVYAIDLNADLAEADTDEALGREAALLGLVTSVNVSCGAHAGSTALARRTLEAAGRAGLAVGAHPGYPDPENKGRRELSLPLEQVREFVRDQLVLLLSIADELGVRVAHVKPHGALYNQAARDPALADAVAETVAEVGVALRLVGLAGSALLVAGERAGLHVVAEGFADRRYGVDGSLVARSEPGAVLERVDEAVAQALDIVERGRVTAVDGTTGVAVAAQTICVHGDTPAAVAMARAIRAALERRGVDVRPVT